MDPATLITSLNLASKIVPSALNALSSIGDTRSDRQNVPDQSVSFDRVLQAERVRATTGSQAVGGVVSQHLAQIPEVQACTNEVEWSSLRFEIRADGHLRLTRADGSSHDVALSDQSKRDLQDVYQQMKQVNPPLVSDHQGMLLHLGPQGSTGSTTAERSLSWTSA